VLRGLTTLPRSIRSGSRGVTTRAALLGPVLAGLCLLSACSSPSTASPGASAAPVDPVVLSEARSTYGGAADGYQRCLDDHGVEYENVDPTDPAAMEVVDPEDPDVLNAVQLCSLAISEPSDPAATEYANEVVRRIGTCLEERGWDATVFEPQGMTDTDGRQVLSFNVPDDQRAEKGYPADEKECQEDAVQAMGGPYSSAAPPSPTG
jgi:hypothetical protein